VKNAVKRIASASVILNVVLLAALLYVLLGRGVGLAEGDPPAVGTAVTNGDVNCDGRLNVTDAVIILEHVYLNRTPPCPLVDVERLKDEAHSLQEQLGDCRSSLVSANLRAALMVRDVESAQLEAAEAHRLLEECRARQILPATGQVLCFGADSDGSARSAVGCGALEVPGQDGFYKVGCARSGRFVLNRDGTLSDRCTGLVWRRHNAFVTWQEALLACEDLDDAGVEDWRLPNALELLSLFDFAQRGALDPLSMQRVCWTSTTAAPGAADSTPSAFAVDFTCCGHDPLRRLAKAETAGFLAVRGP
jgi:hypothetical protein